MCGRRMRCDACVTAARCGMKMPRRACKPRVAALHRPSPLTIQPVSPSPHLCANLGRQARHKHVAKAVGPRHRVIVKVQGGGDVARHNVVGKDVEGVVALLVPARWVQSWPEQREWAAVHGGTGGVRGCRTGGGWRGRYTPAMRDTSSPSPNPCSALCPPHRMYSIDSWPSPT